MNIVEISLKNGSVHARVAKAGTEPSKHTGANLRVLSVEFDTRNQAEADGIEHARSGDPTVQVKLNSAEQLKKFTVSQTSYSYNEGSPLVHHSWELKEVEELNIQSLSIGDLIVEPYHYHEDFTDRGLHIEARATITEEQENLIRVMPTYFPVVRKGISDEPRDMRFGMILWSRKDAEDIKLLLNFVDRTFDDGKPLPGLLEPQMMNMARMTVNVNESLRALLSTLERKGILTTSEKEQVAHVSNKDFENRRKELFRVPDIDEWEG